MSISEKYRQAPWIIQAACAGDVPVIKAFLEGGCQLTEVGHICISKRRMNSVTSNVIGAAAYYGQDKALKFFLKELGRDFVDVKAIETADRNQAKGVAFKPDMQGFTPLQLCIVSPHVNLESVRLLFGADANHEVREAVTNNNIVHLAAKHCQDTAVLQYVVKNAKVDIFERNKQGDNALTICQQFNSAEAAKIIEDCQQAFDETGKKTDELLEQLLGQEEKDQRAK